MRVSLDDPPPSLAVILYVLILAGIVSVLLILPGCMTIDYTVPPPADFPELVIEETHDDQAVSDVCGGNILVPVFGCAYLDFAAGVCRLTLPTKVPEWLRKHERAHCRGYDHDEQTTVKDQWEAYRRR